jgi:hypothetical protein
MNLFGDTLGRLRKSHSELFSEETLVPWEQSQPDLEAGEFDPPKDSDIDSVGNEASWGEDRPEDLAPWTQYSDPWSVEREPGIFEQSPRATEQRRRYGGSPSATGVELIAIYRPFHYYGPDDWGVLFSERNLVHYVDGIYWLLRRSFPPISWSYTLKVVTYAVARHEFTHYLAELEALSTELKRGGQVYIPYHELVYKPTYPSALCLEETVASVWEWDNAVIRTPQPLRDTYRQVLRASLGLAYQQGDRYDHASVRPYEDRLVAQMLGLTANPTKVPEVWGSLPRPYVQPWTRYENVPFRITASAGGVLGPRLNRSPLKKTIRIYHR